MPSEADSIDILIAAKEGRVAEVRLVCDQAPERLSTADKVPLHLAGGLLIPVVGQDGHTALHCAAMGSGTRNDSLEVVGLLLAAGANVNAKTAVRRLTTLFLAV